jgi:hypothetical protein
MMNDEIKKKTSIKKRHKKATRVNLSKPVTQVIKSKQPHKK